MKRIKKAVHTVWTITKKTYAAWYAADPFRQSAVIAYYAVFSIPSLLVIIITLAGVAFGKEAVQGEISQQISSVMGRDTAVQIENFIANASREKNSLLATVIGLFSLILGALGVFLQLQTSLDQIWEVKMKPEITGRKKWVRFFKNRAISFGLVLSLGFLMLISLVLTTALATVSEWINRHMPDFTLFLFQSTNFGISFFSITVLFALMFKVLPDAKVRWRDVWIGAMVTTGLFILGKYGLGIYFSKAEPASTYGAAGSVILIMLWVSYSCMIVFFGAEFTKQHATHFGRAIEPSPDAVHILVSEEERLIYEKKCKTESVT